LPPLRRAPPRADRTADARLGRPGGPLSHDPARHHPHLDPDPGAGARLAAEGPGPDPHARATRPRRRGPTGPAPAPAAPPLDPARRRDLHLSRRARPAGLPPGPRRPDAPAG